MKPDIIILGNPDSRWAGAIQRDIDAGLMPQWVGAVLVSVMADGNARIALVERRTWIAVRMAEQHTRN